MTNRQWLESLTDEELADWCTGEDNWNVITGEYIGLYPHRKNVEYQYPASYGGVLLWLKQKRAEASKE